MGTIAIHRASAAGLRPDARLDSRAAIGGVLAGLACLALLAYGRALSLPFIADDYVQIWLGRAFGPLSGWKDLAADPLYRCRATSLVMTYWTERLFGLDPAAYNWTSLLLHIANAWLVFALGAWRLVGWRVSAVAAAFFAVYEGHQEAVIWYAALPELLVFFFGMAAFLTWVGYVQTGRPWRAVGTLVLFALALFSKESAVVLVPLMLLPVWSERPGLRRWAGWWSAAAAMAVLYTALVFLGKTSHLHFHDGTFSVSAPFWITVPRSLFRLFWVWGVLALACLGLSGSIWHRLRIWGMAVAWAAVSFLPYSFLTYMPFVPSRHTYLASVGLSIVVAAAVLELLSRLPERRRTAALLAVLIAMPNCAYIWTRKQRQYAERAAPTEKLIEFARHSGDPVYVHCFPYGFDAADWAVQLRTHKHAVKVEAPPGVHPANAFCFPAAPKARVAPAQAARSAR